MGDCGYDCHWQQQKLAQLWPNSPTHAVFFDSLDFSDSSFNLSNCCDDLGLRTLLDFLSSPFAHWTVSANFLTETACVFELEDSPNSSTKVRCPRPEGSCSGAVVWPRPLPLLLPLPPFLHHSLICTLLFPSPSSRDDGGPPRGEGAHRASA